MQASRKTPYSIQQECNHLQADIFNKSKTISYFRIKTFMQ